jgi:hypothetical protein
MTQSTTALTALRQGLIATFDVEELKTLCSDLGVDYESLGGAGKEAQVIEERLAEFVEPTAAPLQLVKSQRQTAARIAELARRLPPMAPSWRARPSPIQSG